MSKILVDTNAILRFLLRDIPEQGKKTELLFKKASQKKIQVVIPEAVVFEAQIALYKYYDFPKLVIAEKLETFITPDFLTIESKATFLKTISLYRKFNLSFVDCFLIAKSINEKMKIFTFDRTLLKISEKES